MDGTDKELADTPLVKWSVPVVDEATPLEISGHAGRITAFVGANGSGKSALGLWLNQNSPGVSVKRLIAHRQLWFANAGPDLTSANRESTFTNITNFGNQPRSRWADNIQQGRVSLTLFDLLARLNERNSRLAAMHDSGATREEIEESIEPSILDRVNQILSDARLRIQLVLTTEGTFDVQRENTDSTYPLFKMSDGEKSAVLLAADVITAPDSCVQIIDEPERHLHRSISSGLLEAVAASRPDCHFVLLTHDLELAAGLPAGSAQLFSVSDCRWLGDVATGWGLHPVPDDGAIPESARRAILGGRRKVLFLEGIASSLDTRLATILFPEWTLQPSGGCEQVIRSVSGLAQSADHHWITPRGIVDGDGRADDERVALAKKGIHVLPVSEIESLYYSMPVLQALSNRQAETLGADAGELLNTAVTGSLDAIGKLDTPERLAADVAAKVVARILSSKHPTPDELRDGTGEFAVAVESPYPAILQNLNEMLGAGDLEGIVRAFPIRDTAMNSVVAAALGFKGVGAYEAAARTCVRADDGVREAIRATIGDLPTPA